MSTALLPSPSPLAPLPFPTSGSTPTLLPPLLENIPPDIKRLPQWVCWRLQPIPAANGVPRWTKLPISPATHRPAKPNDPSTWTTYDHAVNAYHNADYDGIGFMFSSHDPFVGVDLDDCRDLDTGIISPAALAHIQLLNTYTEISPSGTGVKCLLKASPLPPGRRRTKNVEIYDTGRYFTITGQILNDLNIIAHRPAEIIQLYRSVFDTPDHPHHHPNSQSSLTPTTPSLPPLPVPDAEILRRARRARNGPKFTRLWSGDTTDAANDHSAADLALCRLLAFWCGPRPDLIDRLFRQARLYRPKWDHPHYADGRTYGQATIETAIHCQADVFYRWPHLRSSNAL